MEKAHRDIEGCPSPTFDGKQVGQQLGIGARHLKHVITAHAGREQRLMRITERRVGHQHAGLR